MNLRVIDESCRPVLISGLHKHRRTLMAFYLLAFGTIYIMMGFGSLQFIMPEIAYQGGIHFWHPAYDTAPGQYWATWIAMSLILAIQGGFLLYPRSSGPLSLLLWQTLSLAGSLNISIVCVLALILLHDAVLAQPLGLRRAFLPVAIVASVLTLLNWIHGWRGYRSVDWHSPILRLLRRLFFVSALLFVISVGALLGSRGDTEPMSANFLVELAVPFSLVSGFWSLGPALILHFRLKPLDGRHP